MGNREVKKPLNTEAVATSVKGRSGVKSRLTDMNSQQLMAIAGKGGNDMLQGQMNTNNVKRDSLLAFMVERLQNIQQLQNAERIEMSRERTWFRAVAKGTDHKPHPKRWHESARLYKRAAQAMTNGNLGQGTSLMKAALLAERNAMASMPKMIKPHLTRKQERAPGMPDEMALTTASAACAARSMPAEIRIADRILAITDVMEKTPPLNRKEGNAWWLENDDEEEEESAEGEG